MVIVESQEMSGKGVGSWFEGWCGNRVEVIVGLEVGGVRVVEGWGWLGLRCC